MGRSRNILLSVLIMLTVVGTVSQAEIPQVISYQGKVTDTSGNPVANGSYTMRFRIYNVSAGGTALWDSGDRSIAVSGGIFSVLLGESPQPAITVDFNADYWLLVTFNGVDQTPRQRMASTGYTYMASGLVPGTEVIGSVTSGAYAAIKGTNTDTSGPTAGLFGESSSPSGAGILGFNGAMSGSAYGVCGRTESTAGSGVYGEAGATSGLTYGVYGQASSPNGYAGYFQGHARVTGNLTVDGSLSGAGIGDITGVNAGTGLAGGGQSGNVTLSVAVPLELSGSVTGGSGAVIRGSNTATTGETSGVRGQSASTSGMGVYGWASATSGYTYGLYGGSSSTSGTGVYGQATATTGYTLGVYGYAASPSGTGVLGVSMSTTGTGATYGVFGRSDSPSSYGVYGWASATTGNTTGVYGSAASTSGYGVYYSGGLAGTGSKSCVVKTSQGPTLMYCQESPENWFEDFGEGQLVNGRCHVELDALFLETVTVDEANPMKVFVTPNEDFGSWWVRKGTTGFTLNAPNAPEGAGFDYRVVAKRKGFETKRLDYCAAAERDSYLYPELREKELQELESERARHDEERARMDEERAIGSRQ